LQGEVFREEAALVEQRVFGAEIRTELGYRSERT
jgi:hypothetical protein